MVQNVEIDGTRKMHFFCTGAKVLKGVHIGQTAVVGDGVVVARDVVSPGTQRVL